MKEFILDAESGIIGGLLLYPDDCNSALHKLSASDFESDLARQTFEFIAGMAKAGKKADAAIFESEQKDADLKMFALSCTRTFVSQANYRGWIQTVKAASRKRRVLGEVSGLLYGDPEPDIILPELSRIIESEKTTSENHEDEQSKFLIDYQERIYEKFDPASRIWTGFTRIDKATGGLLKGALSYVGAPPSTGKTAFAINVAANQLKGNGKVLFFSLEMSRSQIMDRLLSSSLSISYDAISRKYVDKVQSDKMSDAIGRLYKKKQLYIFDDVYSVEDIAAKIYDIRPDLVIVDFIQCVRTSQRFRDGREGINYISAELKRLGKQNNCHMMILSQVARSVDKKTSKPKAPRMSDLKESGNLEADGDYVVMIFRPFVYEKSKDYKPEDSQILLDKNKFGETGVIEMMFRGNVQRFEEVLSI
jgi:replicative DNA helicase